MTLEQGKWILLFGAVAWLTHVAKAVALFFLLWRSRPSDRRGPMRLLVFLLLLALLVLLPYQDRSASKAMNGFLMVCTVFQYAAWLGLAYIIVLEPKL